jgi:phosphoglycolate phosphatase
LGGVLAKQLIVENEAIHLEKASDVVVFDSFVDTLKFFKNAGKILSICSNRGVKSLNIILENNQINQYFENIISCSEVHHDKPDPFCLIELMKKYPNIKAEETIYFGDSKTDADFAQNAGIDYLVIDHYLNKKQFYSMILNAFVLS